jgi:hypothetical protein
MDGLASLLDLLRQIIPTDPILWGAIGVFAGLIGLIIILHPAQREDVAPERDRAERNTAR